MLAGTSKLVAILFLVALVVAPSQGAVITESEPNEIIPDVDGPFTPGADQLQGTITSRDIDMFEFSGQVGKVYTFNLTPNGACTNNWDVAIAIIDSSTVITGVDDNVGCQGETLVGTVPSAGTYYFYVQYIGDPPLGNFPYFVTTSVADGATPTPGSTPAGTPTPVPTPATSAWGALALGLALMIHGSRVVKNRKFA